MRRAVVLFCLLAGCAAQRRPSEQVSAPSVSAYSASFEPSTRSFDVPPAEPVVADLIVRPDVMAITFAVRATAKTADEALRLLREEIGRVAGKLGEGAIMTLCGFRTEYVSHDRVHAYADGRAEITLAPAADYWARAGLLARLSALSKPEPPKEDDKAKTSQEEERTVHVGFGAPRAMVKDVELHRGELNKRFVERARAFATAAQSARAPLDLLRCEPPQPIAQRTISLEEVALSLRVVCQLDFAQKPAS
jgi:hypothetical protein